MKISIINQNNLVRSDQIKVPLFFLNQSPKRSDSSNSFYGSNTFSSACHFSWERKGVHIYSAFPRGLGANHWTLGSGLVHAMKVP